MVEIRALSEAEKAHIARYVGNLKREIKRLALSATEVEPSSDAYLEALDWMQYEGLKLDWRALECDVVNAVLLFLAEHLQSTRDFALGVSSEILVLTHERFVGCMPLEMIAFRPLQPDEGGRWLNEDDPIDRACQAVELLDNAMRRLKAPVDDKPLDWLRVLLGDQWLRLMRSPVPRSNEKEIP